MSVKVFFNNSCKICKMEIDHYKKYSDNSLDWVDITNNDEAISLTSKTQAELLRRLHVIHDGKVIGWREFMRGIYRGYNKEMETRNFFKQNRKMKSSWYEGNTGLPPLDYAIKNALTHGWSHHIERLMILANIMNLCEIKPIYVYKWFMEMFVDSSDWVMVPNVYGMGLFSDCLLYTSPSPRD